MLGDLADHVHEHGVDLSLLELATLGQRHRQVAKRDSFGLHGLFPGSDPRNTQFCFLHVLPFAAAIALMNAGNVLISIAYMYSAIRDT
jgi:hypothetical protein